VGVRDFQPDGRFDGVLIFELAVGPSGGVPAQPAGKAATSSGGPVSLPPVPIVGPDQWVPPPTSALPTAPPEQMPSPGATAAVTATLSVGEEEAAVTPPTAAASSVPSASETFREGAGTQTPARTVPSGAPNTRETPPEAMARTVRASGSGSPAQETATPGVGVRSHQR
jgi:hypothetical protein